MRVTQIIPILGIHSGGPSRSLLDMTEGLRNSGIDATILTNNDLANPCISSEPWVHAIPYKARVFEYNRLFKKEVERVESDLFHVHSIFRYPTTIAMRVAEKRGIPFIVSPRGSLLKAAMSSSSTWIKTVFNKMILFPDLKKAAALHATSREEMEDLLDLGLKRPVILIPNSIRMPDTLSNHRIQSRFRVGVCGRINPIKNIDGIIRAWAKSGLNNTNAELVIIGGAKREKEFSYLDDLHQLERELKIGNIFWAGPCYGPEKDALFESLSILLLGSHSENFGMVVPEALSMGIPVAASKGTPWEMLERTRAGWWIDNSDDSIAATLSNAYRLFQEGGNEMERMGQNGLRLVKEYYSQEAVAGKWIEAYNWILKGKEQPDFVTIV